VPSGSTKPVYSQIIMKKPPAGFTLIELLTVMIVIAILASLVLATAGFIQRKGASSKAEGEVAAMSAALENYKADNGIYPRDDAAPNPPPGAETTKFVTTLDARAHFDATQANYKNASLFLYRSLSGDRSKNYQIDATDKVANVQPPIYMEFKPGMLAGKKTGNTLTTVEYIVDPFGGAYGYSLAFAAALEANPSTPPTKGYNPTFDLWSTAGAKNSADSGKWIKSW